MVELQGDAAAPRVAIVTNERGQLRRDFQHSNHARKLTINDEADQTEQLGHSRRFNRFRHLDTKFIRYLIENQILFYFFNFLFIFFF